MATKNPAKYLENGQVSVVCVRACVLYMHCLYVHVSLSVCVCVCGCGCVLHVYHVFTNEDKSFNLITELKLNNFYHAEWMTN